MDHLMRFDDIAKILLIVCLGEFQRSLRRIANLVGMHVMVNCVCAQSPTTSTTEPPLNRVRNIVCVRNSKFHILGIATLYREYGKHKNATHRSSTIDGEQVMLTGDVRHDEGGHFLREH